MTKRASQDLMEFMTTGEVARMLNVSNIHVHRLVAAGTLPVAGRAGKGSILLFWPGDVERVFAERKKNPPRPGRPRTPPGERSVEKVIKQAKKKKTKGKGKKTK